MLLHLPPEMLQKIFSHSSASDVMSCSATCVDLRNSLNCDVIWECLTVEHFGKHLTSSSLFKMGCKISPGFQLPPSGAGRLHELCPWRKKFMQEVHLANNWRRFRYKPYNLGESEASAVDLNNSVIVICYLSYFKVWDVEKEEIIQIEPLSLKPLFFSSWTGIDVFRLYDDFLVIVQCQLLQIFEKHADNSFEMKYRVLFNDFHQEIPINTRDITLWYLTCVNEQMQWVPCAISNNYFVGSPSHTSSRRFSMHIWDIKEKREICRKALPLEYETYRHLEYHLTSSKCFMLFQSQTSTKVFRYLINENLLEPVPIDFGPNDTVILTETYIGSVFQFFRDSQLVLWKQNNYSIAYKLSLRGLNKYFGFHDDHFCFASERSIIVFDVKTFKVSSKCVYNHPRYNRDRMFFINSNLLFVLRYYNPAEMWDISSLKGKNIGRFYPDFNNFMTLFTNLSQSKCLFVMSCYNKLCAFSFW